jgi:hypothetical protein
MAPVVDHSVTRLLTKNTASRAAFWIWAVMLFALATSLTAAHLYALPKPADDDTVLASSLNGLRAESERSWLAVHVLYAQCRCSRRILDHLALDARPQGVSEKVLLVGTNAELSSDLRRMSDRGFEIINTTSSELRERFHVQAVPLLLVLGPDGVIRYSGGYTERKQGLDIRDRQIIEGLVENRPAPELPVFGCAVSKQLQRLLDPLALKARSP